jgi:Sec-independent protein translocase protein TatA
MQNNFTLLRGAASALRKLRNAAQRQENESSHVIDADNERDKREAQNRVALLAINLSRR